MSNYGLTQLINKRTYFTEHSSSLIDIIMTSKVNSIIASEVCDPFLPNLMRYNCLVAVILHFLSSNPKIINAKYGNLTK